MSDPLAIDLFCGLGGWTDGLLAAGFNVIGFDIERHDYGDGARYPAQLVLQNVLTIHGRQFRDASLIVASPPCQEYSYMAMPWTLAKEKATRIRADIAEQVRLNALFNACFRIQREACEAAGRFIPLIVENVRGAIPWVGRSRWNYGSFHLWGDVPALMPMSVKTLKGGWLSQADGAPMRRDDGVKAPGMNWSDPEKRGQDFTRLAGAHAGVNTVGHVNQRDGHGHTRHLTNQAEHVAAGVKVSSGWFGSYAEHKAAGTISPGRMHGKGSKARKAASAAIAKIPFPLSSYIARTYYPSPQ